MGNPNGHKIIERIWQKVKKLVNTPLWCKSLGKADFIEIFLKTLYYLKHNSIIENDFLI